MRFQSLSPSIVRIASLCLLLTLVVLRAGALAQGGAETLILFNPTVPETPESIRFDRFDNAYISLAFTGEIRKVMPDGTQSTLTFIPIGAPCGFMFPPVALLGLTIDNQDRLYAAAFACDPANQGVWRIDTDTGAAELIVQAPSSFTVWNGIDEHNGVIYAADTFVGLIWRMPAAGVTPEIWLDDPLLKPVPGVAAPGPNGIRFFRHEVYVANSSSGNIIATPVLFDGSAGEPRIHATLPAGQGCDEFAIDVHGSIYCTTDPTNILIRLDPDGTTEIILTAADLLDGPTSATFGRQGENRKNLYITNAAFPFFTTTFRPSLMRLRLDVPGAP